MATARLTFCVVRQSRKKEKKEKKSLGELITRAQVEAYSRRWGALGGVMVMRGKCGGREGREGRDRERKVYLRGEQELVRLHRDFLGVLVRVL